MKSHSRRPRRDFSCPPDRTPRPRRAFPAMLPTRQSRAFLLPACLAAPPFAACLTRRSLPPHRPDCTRQTFFIASRTTTHIRLTCLPCPTATPYCAPARTPRQAFPRPLKPPDISPTSPTAGSPPHPTALTAPDRLSSSPRPHTLAGISCHDPTPSSRQDFSSSPARTPRPRRAFPPRPNPAKPAGFFLPHASPPALRRMPFTSVVAARHTALTVPTDFSSSPRPHTLAGHFPMPNPVKPADFLHRQPDTSPRRDFCLPDRTPTPRRTVHPAILRLHTHPTNPEAHHLPLTRRSLPLPQQFFSYGDCFGCAEQV